MSRPTNEAVADRIGLTHSGVSRIRSGDRVPSLDTMRSIEQAYDWSLEAQARAVAEGKYVQQLERVLEDDEAKAPTV